MHIVVVPLALSFVDAHLGYSHVLMHVLSSLGGVLPRAYTVLVPVGGASLYPTAPTRICRLKSRTVQLLYRMGLTGRISLFPDRFLNL